MAEHENEFVDDVTSAGPGIQNQRRRALVAGATLLASGALPGWVRAAADAAEGAAGSGGTAGAADTGSSAAAADAAGNGAGNPAGGAADRAAAPGSPAVVGTKKVPRLLLAGPYATVSNPLIRIVEAGLLKDVAEKVEFITWRTPDQLRAMALKGEADFMAMPSNLAANLYNRGAKVQLLNIGIWGILWMLARRDGLKTLADFKGEEVVMPFRGDMPDAVFRLLCTKQGINPDKDLTLRYVASPLDAMQLLITRQCAAGRSGHCGGAAQDAVVPGECDCADAVPQCEHSGRVGPGVQSRSAFPAGGHCGAGGAAGQQIACGGDGGGLCGGAGLV